MFLGRHVAGGHGRVGSLGSFRAKTGRRGGRGGSWQDARLPRCGQVGRRAFPHPLGAGFEGVEPLRQVGAEAFRPNLHLPHGDLGPQTGPHDFFPQVSRNSGDLLNFFQTLAGQEKVYGAGAGVIFFCVHGISPQIFKKNNVI